jgi:hypothetical protein
MNFPADLHPVAGECRGKGKVLQRRQLYMEPLEFFRFDTSSLMVGKGRAAAEIPLYYRHKETGCALVTTKATFGHWKTAGRCDSRILRREDARAIQRANRPRRRLTRPRQPNRFRLALSENVKTASPSASSWRCGGSR